MHTMGQRRWQAAYRLLKVAGLIDPVNGHLRTHSRERARLALRAEVEAQRRRLVHGTYTLPF